MEKKTWQTRLRELDTSLGESFLESSTAIDEHLMAVMRELGSSEMGGSGDSQEALSQLAMAVECVHLLRVEAIEMAEEIRDRAVENIRTVDVKGKTALNPAPEHVGSTDVQGETAATEVGPSQKQQIPCAGEPHAVFQTEAELISFVERATTAINNIINEKACKKGREDMAKFKQSQALKRSLLAPGEIYCDIEFLEQAHESICEILERVPDLDGELAGEVNEAATRAFSRLTMILRWGESAQKGDAVDIDDSDNDRADDAQEAENSHERVQCAEGGAS